MNTLWRNDRSLLGADLRFDTFMVGHPRCNRYAMAFEINC